MQYSSKIREEELKNRVAADFFSKYDCTGIIKDIDFAVASAPLSNRTLPLIERSRNEREYLLWAEAKKNSTDVIAMLTQLVLTIGKARTYNDVLPPKFLGCFDCEKIAFIPYADIQDIFHQNDFNWNITPSNRESKEFKLVYSQIEKIINSDKPHKTYIFSFDDENSLKLFILKNFLVGKSDISKIRIDKNNFISIYGKWLEAVKPTIAVNWNAAKKIGIIDGDFYLADLLSRENKTLKEKLFVLLKTNYYELDQKLDDSGFFSSKKADFTDKQKAHNTFWAIYERPPREDYWDYIIERRDLLVPQDVRERKGSFFTPKIWVELSQKYIADVLGEDWQEEYYVWDCAAGTGNLLAGLTNRYNIWASTIDKADVDVMHDRIDNGANLLKDHCFQFDFLNDDFNKLPEGLRKIIDDPMKRKKLIVYINPPYAEVTNARTQRNTGENRIGLANSKTFNIYESRVGTAVRELFVQFLVRIYEEINGCRLANFSTMKNLQASNFLDFREFFRAKLDKIFLVPAFTFDNVNGQFPIAFMIWNTNKKEIFIQSTADVYDKDENFIGTKNIYSYKDDKYIIEWLRKYYDKKGEKIAYLRMLGTDMQHNKDIFISNELSKNDFKKHLYTTITKNNVIEMCIYLSVRHCIEATWLNDRDQFLYPNDSWETDLEFQSDCLAFALFHGQNKISAANGINHWIPFIEWDVAAHEKFDSHFMTDFIAGKVELMLAEPSIFYNASAGGGGGESRAPYKKKKELKFSTEARKVFKAGLKLWKYYHAQPKCNVNASLYDIREHFQGRNAQGKMNNKSDDEKYNELIGDLRSALKELAEKIEPKVYEYGFLKA